MNIPEIFKYGSLISVPLFTVIALLIIKNAHGFSFRKHTISMSINFLANSYLGLIFRLNFVIKALLDLSFSLYVLNHFKISFGSPAGLTLISSAVLFGTLAYFIEGRHAFLHGFIVYLSGVLWVLGQIFVVTIMGDKFLLYASIIALTIPIIIGFSFLFAKKTNVFVQSVCIVIWYVWLLVFVFRYLII